MHGERDNRDGRESDVHSRVSRIETAVENHGEALRGLRADNVRLEQEFREGFAELGAKIDRIASSQNAAARTNWGAVASWAGVSFTAIAFIGLSYVRPLEITNGAQDREMTAIRQELIDQRRAQHEADVKHAVLEERAAWIAGWSALGARAGGSK